MKPAVKARLEQLERAARRHELSRDHVGDLDALLQATAAKYQAPYPPPEKQSVLTLLALVLCGLGDVPAVYLDELLSRLDRTAPAPGPWDRAWPAACGHMAAVLRETLELPAP